MTRMYVCVAGWGHKKPDSNYSKNCKRLHLMITGPTVALGGNWTLSISLRLSDFSVRFFFLLYSSEHFSHICLYKNNATLNPAFYISSTRLFRNWPLRKKKNKKRFDIYSKKCRVQYSKQECSLSHLNTVVSFCTEADRHLSPFFLPLFLLSKSMGRSERSGETSVQLHRSVIGLTSTQFPPKALYHLTFL